MGFEKFKVKGRLETTIGNTDVGGTLIPTGTIGLWMVSAVPDGWLECSGGTFSATSFPTLATTLGDAFGTHSGDSYYLPDFRGRTAVGSGSGSGLTVRTLGQWGGQESITLTQDIISHNHGMSHTHSLTSHTHNTSGHTSTAHNGPLHIHDGGAPHTHTSQIGSPGIHTHTFSFTPGGSSFGSGQTRIGPGSTLSNVGSPNGHVHNQTAIPTVTSSTNNVTVAALTSNDTGDSSPSTTGTPSQASSGTYTGAMSAIAIVQSSFILKYIIKV